MSRPIKRDGSDMPKICESCWGEYADRRCNRLDCMRQICLLCFDNDRECCAKCSPVMIVCHCRKAFPIKTENDVLNWIHHFDNFVSMSRSAIKALKKGCQTCGNDVVTPMPYRPQYRFIRNYFLLGLEVSTYTMMSVERALEEASATVEWKPQCSVCIISGLKNLELDVTKKS